MHTSTHTGLLRIATLVAFLLIASVASAQAAPSAAVGTTGYNTVTVVNDGTQGTVVNGVFRVSPGTASTTLATIQLVSTQGNSVQTAAIPFTLTVSGAGSASNLSGCQIVNSSGTVLSSGSNTQNVIVSGSNVITLDNPIVVAPGTTQNFPLRCNVSSATPIGTTFQIAANPGATIFSFPGSLAVTSTAIPSIQNNTVTLGNVTLGTVRLDAGASGSAIRIPSVPLSASTLGSASLASVSNCQLFDPSGVSLNSGANASGALSAGANTLILNTPLIIPSGGATTLSLRCTVLPGTGGTLVLLPGAGAFSATAVTSGASVTPTVTTLASTPVSLGGAVVPPPGVPGTGLGTHTTGFFATLLAAVALLGGLLYFRNRKVAA